MPPKNKKNAPPSTPRKGGGGHKTRSKPQPPSEFQPNQELLSPDDSATLMEVKKGTLTTVLAAITTQVDYLSQGKALQAVTLSAQPRTRAGENPTASPSASFNPNTGEQVRMRVKH